MSDLSLVIDIGKSHARLVMVDHDGEVVERHQCRNASRMAALGYLALDLGRLERWMAQTLRASANTRHCAHAIATTHGAAIVALSDHGLAWEPLDYEFDGFMPTLDAATAAASASLDRAYRHACDPFEQTLSPALPAGLNAARQLFWMQHRHPDAWAGTRCLLPYPQYWAWRLSAVAASERSSLGCHTQLWRPQQGTYSDLARGTGWDTLFAPLRQAWDVLGPIRTDLARDWGLPARCQVHVGVHDSNACLARLMGPDAHHAPPGLSLVSSGTWTVVMAPGAPVTALHPARDMLGNVDVLGRATPTARFMGGRDFEFLSGGADPAAGTVDDVQRLIDTDTLAVPPEVAARTGAAAREPAIRRGSRWLEPPGTKHLAAGMRSALAAMYCAQCTADLVQRLWKGAPRLQHVLHVDGPLAHNALYLSLLQALLPTYTCMASEDTLEGTARGAWRLCRWCEPAAATFARPVMACNARGLAAYHRLWQAVVA